MRKHRTRPEAGEQFSTRQGCIVEVLEYRNYEEVLVRFLDENGHEAVTSKGNLLKGWVKNPYHPEVRGVGFFGVGPYVAKNGKTLSKEYVHWTGMLTRSYYEKYHERFPSYIGVEVDSRWHNFQKFAEWCQWQKGFDDPKSVLDKDLLPCGGKLYSPETCVFLPPELNSLIVSVKKEGKKYPTGISFQTGCKKFIVSCAVNGKNKNLGRYSCPEEAFLVYKDFKESLVRQRAEEYKNRIDTRAYEALKNFTVDEG